MEIWKDIKDYEGLYQVSNKGRVRSLNYNHTSATKTLKQINVQGYMKVNLHKNGKMKMFFIHRLVAEAFIPNPDNLPQVNHKSEIKTDNRVENLEWCDAKYNNTYGNRIKKTTNKTTNGKKSKPVLQFTQGGEFVKEWPSMMEVKRKLGIRQGGISNCCLCRCKSAGGFVWKYKEKEVV